MFLPFLPCPICRVCYPLPLWHFPCNSGCNSFISFSVCSNLKGMSIVCLCISLPCSCKIRGGLKSKRMGKRVHSELLCFWTRGRMLWSILQQCYVQKQKGIFSQFHLYKYRFLNFLALICSPRVFIIFLIEYLCSIAIFHFSFELAVLPLEFQVNNCYWTVVT